MSSAANFEWEEFARFNGTDQPIKVEAFQHADPPVRWRIQAGLALSSGTTPGWVVYAETSTARVLVEDLTRPHPGVRLYTVGVGGYLVDARGDQHRLLEAGSSWDDQGTLSILCTLDPLEGMHEQPYGSDPDPRHRRVTLSLLQPDEAEDLALPLLIALGQVP